jgi:hypothetical protein
MLVSEFTWLRRDAVTAGVAAQPKAIAEAVDVRKVDFAPGFIFWFVVPHVAIPTLDGHLLSHREP